MYNLRIPFTNDSYEFDWDELIKEQRILRISERDKSLETFISNCLEYEVDKWLSFYNWQDNIVERPEEINLVAENNEDFR